MDLESVLNGLQLGGARYLLAPHWDESVAKLGGQIPGFLLPDAVRTARAFGGFETEAEEPLLASAARIASDPALRALAWHCVRLLYECPDYEGTLIGRWPELRVLGKASGDFYLLIAMAMVPGVRAKHRAMGVPEEVTRATCTQLSCFASNYARMAEGRLGIPQHQMYWLRHYPAGRLFRLGRMEYKIEPFSGGVEVYRNRTTGRVVALAADGTRFNREGYIDASGSIPEDPQGWTARLRMGADAVHGWPVSPRGMGLRQEVALPLREWACALTKGEPTIEMHIPAGGRMTAESGGDSMRRACAFFDEYLPGHGCRSISCRSWIFNTQFEEVRMSSANLVEFQRELYLYPTPSNGKEGWWFIFLQEDIDPATAPRDTSLRRGVADFLMTGRRWRGGGMFFLRADLPDYGTQCYRRPLCTGDLRME